jgi:intracellular multiplication protein IcmJ
VTFLPINLGIRRVSDTETGAGQKAPKPLDKSKTEKILKRDDYTCRFCGFRSPKFQRVMFYAANDAADPYVTTCTFCEQVNMLERAGMAGSGVLIWLPEIGQAELNHISRAIYMARHAAEETLTAAAQRALDSLLARRNDAKKRLGSDDPIVLVTVLQENLSDADYKAAGAKLTGIRLLPFDKYVMRGPKGDMDQFPHMLKYWASAEGPYAQIPTEKWLDLFKEVG